MISSPSWLAALLLSCIQPLFLPIGSSAEVSVSSLPRRIIAPTQSNGGQKLDCEGCHFRSREGGGFRRGLKFEISKAWQSKLLVGLAGSLGANGNCKIGDRCFAWKDCRWVTYALLFNASTEDLWFRTDRWFINLPFPGALAPGKDGWLRIPPGRSALFLAGPYTLGCTDTLDSKELRLYKGKAKAYIGRLRWSALCSRCHYKGQVTPPLK